MAEKKNGFWRTLWYGPEPATVDVQTATQPVAQKRTAGEGVVPSSRTVASPVTTDSALSIAAVYRAVSIMATAVSQLSLDAIRGGQPIDRPALLARPDLNSSRRAFMEQTTVSMALTGNAYWRLYRGDATSQPANVEVLNPNNISITTEDGKTVYRYGSDRVFQPHEIKHLKLLRVPGSEYGLGPIQATKAELAGMLDLRDYNANWFAKGGVPNGVLSTDQYLNSDQALEYKEAWTQNQLDGNGRGVVVLGNGLSYAPVYLSPSDALFIEQTQMNTTEIARLFGVPANYLLAAVEGSSITYTTLTQVDTVFLKYTLMNYLSEMEEAFSDLLPRGQTAVFNIESFLRADTASRYAAYSTALSAGFLTLSEVREIEGLPPLNGNEGNTND